MKTCAMVLVLCFVLAGCGARGTSRGASSNMGSKEVELRLNLIESHINNDQPQLALQELFKVEPAAKHMSRFHFDSGMIYIGLQELEQARDGFAKAVEIDEDFGEAWNNLGKVEEALGRDSEAEAAYRKAIGILTYVTPEFPAYNLGVLLLRQGRASEAEELGRKALARNWRYIPAYKLLSDAFVAQNRLDDAESVLKSGLEADMDSTSTILALAEHQVRMGKTAEARELFTRIVKQYPKSNEAKLARDYLDFLQ
ncbi:tetratricopeptide repeat protein [Desulfomicrobium baculatum]|uniref:TPR repeat-containing protein n=1 Tax=Desulfomicrobium baculatum (strain DSM 4028 / VKM B-1378 / X) TaxID=525897 RepID=C7LWV1_DESBD|nr:tetratricopeptide repeat protein [Desulfomicrobium baculatum]ACU91161.1 TPR repeat-containing protein [Desulfomicrobium baculatum DSM 4028]